MSNLEAMKISPIISILLIFSFINPQRLYAEQKVSIENMMGEIKGHIISKKWNWDSSFFTDSGWKEKGTSVSGRPLIYWTCGKPDSENVSLILSAVHGDEITPVYFGFRVVEWIKARPELCEKSFVIVAPIVNPDGFFRYSSGTRTNFNKVDLNRNFDTPEWEGHALKLWKEKFGSQRRYYPGDKAASEPEVMFQKWLIEEFKPAKILTVHAPLNHLDFDGPFSGPDSETVKKFTETYIKSCDILKQQLDKSATGLNFYAFGTFPGSLGNYAGRYKGIPTITVELPTIDYKMAPVYFGQMEKGLNVFLNYEIKDRPRPLANKD
jgi:protein MpaA